MKTQKNAKEYNKLSQKKKYEKSCSIVAKNELQILDSSQRKKIGFILMTNV